MEVRKEVIRSGKHVYIDEDGKPATLDATPAKIKHYFDNGQAMIAAKLPIPVPLEHDPKAHPMNAADLAADRVRNNAGFVTSYETDVIKDAKTGLDIHRLISVCDIKDAKVAEQVKNQTIPFVSPWISSFTDGTGKKWDEVVSHVALTTRPRIADQGKFELTSLPVALSLAAPIAKVPEKGIVISRAGLLKADGKPKFPMAFSLMAGVKLSKDEIKKIEEEEDADIDDDGIPDKEEGKGEGEPMAGEIAKDEAMDGMDDSAGDVSFEELIPHLLEMHGIHVPAGGKGKEFLQALVQGLLVSAKGLAAQNDEGNVLDPLKDPAAPPESPNPVMQESPPMYMSLTRAEVAKITDPKEKKVAEAFLSLREENEKNKAIAESSRKSILAEATGLRQKRIENLAKRLPVVARDKLIQQASAPQMQLSLGNDGVVQDPMAVTLELFEQGLPDLPALMRGDIRLSDLKAQAQPQDGTITDARAQEIANGQLGRLAPA